MTDEIPDSGFIDISSVTIWAAIPTLAQSSYDFVDQWHGNYSIPEGAYFAQRGGTIREPLFGRRDGRTFMTQLTQSDDETLEQFKQRVYEKDLSWGVYYDKDENAETFFCNFGNVGTEDNNGIDYADFTGRGQEYAETYPSIFGENGASHGNIVSYYIEFKTYYPEVVGSKLVANTATLTSHQGSDQFARVGGNQAMYTVGIGGGTGVARKNELVVRVMDADDTTQPIAGATVKVQQKVGDDWKDVSGFESLATDKDGRVSVGPFVAGTYRVVQAGWADGYVANRYEFEDVGNATVNSVNTATGEFTVTGDEKFGFAALIVNWREQAEITLTPQSMTAYTGGSSLSETSFPAVRYAVSGVDEETFEGLTLTYDGTQVTAAKAGNYWTLTGLPASFTLNGAAEASGDDGDAGVYDISVDVSKLVATSDDAGAGRFNVSVAASHGATATVRNVSRPEGVLDGKVDVAQPVVGSAEKVDTADGVGIAVIDEGATYYTNGSAKNLGLLGNGESGAQISLLFDDLLAGTDESTTQELLLDHANNRLEEGEQLSLDTTEFKYLDLVNENDGNAWVSCDKDVTIYWPIPSEAADADPESFKVYHFEGLHREYRDELENQINACNVTSVECEVVGDNIVFTLSADAEGGCFSPFALSWEPGAYDLTYEWNWGETYDGSTLYDAEGNVTKDRPQLPAGQTDLAAGTEVAVDTTNSTACVYYTRDDYGNVNGKYTFSGWSAKTVADDPDDVESVAIDDGKLSMPSADVVVSGEWAYIVVAQQTYTVHYVYDNAPEGVETEYPLPVDDGAYVKNEPVVVSSTPTVGAEYEGYTFQGWKPIGDDVVVEDGAFAMPARDVWISGTWKADDDTPYTVEFYSRRTAPIPPNRTRRTNASVRPTPRSRSPRRTSRLIVRATSLTRMPPTFSPVPSQAMARSC